MNTTKLLLLSLVLTMRGAAFPQSPSPRSLTAQFSGSIVDGASAGIPKATILIEGNRQNWNLESNATGEFRINLPSGNYRFTIYRAHFKPLIVSDFCIGGGSKIGYEFHMEKGECNDCDWVPDDLRPIPVEPVSIIDEIIKRKPPK